MPEKPGFLAKILGGNMERDYRNPVSGPPRAPTVAKFGFLVRPRAPKFRGGPLWVGAVRRGTASLIYR